MVPRWHQDGAKMSPPHPPLKMNYFKNAEAILIQASRAYLLHDCVHRLFATVSKMASVSEWITEMQKALDAAESSSFSSIGSELFHCGSCGLDKVKAEMTKVRTKMSFLPEALRCVAWSATG